MEENQVVQPIVENEEMGSVKIADEVVAIIAGIEAANIKGVAGMSSGIAGGLADMLGRKNLAKGIKVDIKEQEALIDLFIIVEYGCRIPEVAWEVQERVKSAVETMTGLKVSKVNIHVQGVNTEKETKKQDTALQKEEIKK